jgi:hypothetical protein
VLGRLKQLAHPRRGRLGLVDPAARLGNERALELRPDPRPHLQRRDASLDRRILVAPGALHLGQPRLDRLARHALAGLRRRGRRLHARRQRRDEIGVSIHLCLHTPSDSHNQCAVIVPTGTPRSDVAPTSAPATAFARFVLPAGRVIDEFPAAARGAAFELLELLPHARLVEQLAARAVQ